MLKNRYSLVLIFAILSIIFGCKANSRNILVIGDSNSAASNSWVIKLNKLLPDYKILNTAIHGNTIGFDNLGRQDLNSLRCITHYLQKADNELRKVDLILIMLGTNDCKAIFKDSTSVVIPNLEKLIRKINQHYAGKTGACPEIILISPAPIADDTALEEKYHGAQKRLEQFCMHYSDVADRTGIRYLDLHSELKSAGKTIHTDGIHLNDDTYQRIATIVKEFITNCL